MKYGGGNYRRKAKERVSFLFARGGGKLSPPPPPPEQKIIMHS